MGKSRKSFSLRSERNIPLSEQLLLSKTVKPSQRLKVMSSEDEDETYVDERLSKKILEQARLQQEELAEEFGYKNDEDLEATKTVSLGGPSKESDAEDQMPEQGEDYECIKVKEEDEKAIQMFMGEEPAKKYTLYDWILETIAEKQKKVMACMPNDNVRHFEKMDAKLFQEMDERLVSMFKEVAKVLRSYRSGKIPKFFKIIPSMSNWEQALYLTDPDKWSAAAMFQATRLFISNLREKLAQRFLNLVLLPRIRDDIAEYKKINFHLYEALCKSLFKPAAFFKGILLPLCEGQDCTLREAIIIGSILRKYSIPVLHSSAAIMKICDMNYSGASSIFLRILYEKRYALPYKVIDASVNHFYSFCSDKRELPVLWHQSLLSFVQHYKEDISTEQKEALLELLKIHAHKQITPEIRREIVHSKCRDVEEILTEPEVSMETKASS